MMVVFAGHPTVPSAGGRPRGADARRPPYPVVQGRRQCHLLPGRGGIIVSWCYPRVMGVIGVTDQWPSQ